jgi:hypothetical protein
VVKIKECRIIYRHAARWEENAYSSDADCSPTRYVDPNESERKKPDAAGKGGAVASAVKVKED